MTARLPPTLAGIRAGGRRHPEFSAVVLAVLAWVALVVLHTGGRAHGPLYPLWTLMCVAMTVPTALFAVRHVGLNSLRWRRQRAIAWFLVAYLSVWMAVGLLVVPVVGLVGGPAALAAALLAAAAWQVLPYLARFRRACHRTVALPLRGWPAVRADLRYGWRHGLACVGVCWPLMLVMALAMHRGLLWMVLLAVAGAGTKLLPRARRFARPAALVLVSLAAGALLSG